MATSTTRIPRTSGFGSTFGCEVGNGGTRGENIALLSVIETIHQGLQARLEPKDITRNYKVIDELILFMHEKKIFKVYYKIIIKEIKLSHSLSGS